VVVQACPDKLFARLKGSLNIVTAANITELKTNLGATTPELNVVIINNLI
jgi:hypothetical protein